jgi:hypothetical protein
MSKLTEAGGKYRAYTKEWCGNNQLSFETASFFCVCPVFVDSVQARSVLF